VSLLFCLEPVLSRRQRINASVRPIVVALHQAGLMIDTGAPAIRARGRFACAIALSGYQQELRANLPIVSIRLLRFGPAPSLHAEGNVMYPKFMVALIIGAVATLSGCSSKSEVDALKASVAQAQQAATEARAMAAANQQSLQVLAAKTDAAVDAAEQARLTSQEASSKIDRAFRRGMHK
jgi:hypothetical protein